MRKSFKINFVPLPAPFWSIALWLFFAFLCWTFFFFFWADLLPFLSWFRCLDSLSLFLIFLQKLCLCIVIDFYNLYISFFRLRLLHHWWLTRMMFLYFIKNVFGGWRRILLQSFSALSLLRCSSKELSGIVSFLRTNFRNCQHLFI